MRVFFDIKHLYYLPQYIPVSTALSKQGVDCLFVLYRQEDLNEQLEHAIAVQGLNYVKVLNERQAKELYVNERPDWIIFGNAINHLDKIHEHSKTILMQHGVGPKSCYYDVSESDIQYRFVEGKHRLERLKARFPKKHFIDTGYAKLDPIIQESVSTPSLIDLGLDPSKDTVLYAPTFYPSSIERLPKHWPEQLKEYNLIIKPHYFSLLKSNYKKQLKRMHYWEKYDNVYLASITDTNILPFMSIADILVSDTSSTLFEFTALNKPAIWCDFYKVRWGYRGPLRWRLKKRLDDDLSYFEQVAQRVSSPKSLNQQIAVHLEHPELKEQQRLNITEYLLGKVDGLCSQRICQFMLKEH